MTYVILVIVIIESVLLVLIQRKLKCHLLELHRLKKHDNIMTTRFILLNRWLEKREEGNTIPDFLIKKGIDRVGIYGLSTFAERLIAEIAANNIQIRYIIDKRFDLQGGKYDNIPVISSDLAWKFPDVHIIIVTTIHQLEEVRQNLEAKEITPGLEIKGLNELVDEM